MAHQKYGYEQFRTHKFFGLFWEQGCVSSDTEFLTTGGWKRIDEYCEGDLVGQWDPATLEVSLVEPSEYHVYPSDGFHHFKHNRGLDQMLCSSHRMPTLTKQNRNAGFTHAGELVDRLSASPTAMQFLPTTYRLSLGKGIQSKLGMSENDIRLQVAVQADGYFPSNCKTSRCTIRLKKGRKIERLRWLLRDTSNVYERVCKTTGYTIFSFEAPVKQKDYHGFWWEADQEDMKIIKSECLQWDGNQERQEFYTTIESDADFIQLVFGGIGCYASKGADGRGNFVVRARKSNKGLTTVRASNITYYPPQEGDKKYCFTTPSGGLLLRRNGKVFPTGNTGKTKTLLDHAAHAYARGAIDCVVVIAPNGVHANWVVEEIPKHLAVADDEYISWTYYNSKGKRWEKEFVGVIDEANHRDKLKIICFPTEGFSRAKKQFAALEYLLKTHRCFGIIDESDDIGNPDAKRTKYLIKQAPKFVARRIATGTPVDSKPLAAWSQLQFLSPSILKQDYYSFRARYSYMADKVIKKGAREIIQKFPVGHRNLDKLGAIMKTCSDRVLKEDCVDLPAKVYKTIPLEMGREQNRFYRDMEERAFYLLEEFQEVEAACREGQVAPEELEEARVVYAKNALDLMGKLSRITGGFADKGVFIKDEPKIRWLRENVDKYTATTDLITWCRYRDEIDAVVEALGEDRCAVVHGGVLGEAREEQIYRFKNDETCDTLVTNRTMSRGHTLVNASNNVFFSNSYSLRDRRQSEDRTHRTGQTSKCLYLDLVCVDTIDEGVLKALKQKKDVSDLVLGDPARAWVQMVSK